MTDIALFLAGGFLGWLITHIYARKSEKQLREIADKMDQIGQAFGRVIEDHGTVEWTRDPQGQITFGRVFTATITESLNATDQVNATVTKNM